MTTKSAEMATTITKTRHPAERLITSQPTRRRFTVAEYYAMADVGILAENDRIELLDGDLIVMPPIGVWQRLER